MQHCKGNKYPAITDTYTKILKEEEGEAVKGKILERFYFYEQDKKSRFGLATGEGALYANGIIKKGGGKRAKSYSVRPRANGIRL